MAAAPTPSLFCSAKPDGRAATELITFNNSNKKWVVEKVMLGVGALDRCSLLGVSARGGGVREGGSVFVRKTCLQTLARLKRKEQLRSVYIFFNCVFSIKFAPYFAFLENLK